MEKPEENGGNDSADLNIFEGTVRGDAIVAIRGLVEEHLKPELIHVEDPISKIIVPAMLDTDGVTAIPASVFNDYLLEPRDRRGTAKLTSLASFIALVNRFKSKDTVIFAHDDREKPKLTAVLDYHAEGHDSSPAFGRHRAEFAFPLSDEWKAWQAKDKTQMNLVDFAEFLEDRIVDVDDPSSALSDQIGKLVTTLGGKGQLATPTRLIELSRGLSIHENSAISEAVKLSSGEATINFQNEHVDAHGNAVSVPSMFLLAIPVFRSGVPYQVLARLRYRVRGGLVFWYELSRTDQVFDHAFDEAVREASDETAAPSFMGAPEV